MAIKGIVLDAVDGGAEVILTVDKGGEVTLLTCIPAEVYNKDTDELEDGELTTLAAVKIKDLFSSIDLLANAFYAETPEEHPDFKDVRSGQDEDVKEAWPPSEPPFINGG